MLTFYDIVQYDDFRKYVENRLSAVANKPYEFPTVFPPLYRYLSFNKYVVHDILNNRISLSSVGSFNDSYDSVIHVYGSQEEIDRAVDEELEKLKNAIGSLDDEKSYKKALKNYYEEESNLKRTSLDFLNTYACCFSTKKDSILMWSHYAEENMGICIAYDFNQWQNNEICSKLLFPVAYSDAPIDVSDLIYDEEHKVYQYPFDAAVLCAALNKSAEWSYENEWRLILTDLCLPKQNKPKYISRCIEIFPTEIYFGCHFLKRFFYYDNDQEKTCHEDFEYLIKLLDYLIENHIPTFIMKSKIGEFTLFPYPIDTSKLRNFIIKNFSNKIPQRIKYYDSIYNNLLSMLEKELINV